MSALKYPHISAPGPNFKNTFARIKAVYMQNFNSLASKLWEIFEVKMEGVKAYESDSACQCGGFCIIQHTKMIGK